MRLITYINETQEIPYKEINALIASNQCKPIRLAVRDKMLFRGAKGKPLAYKATSREDRKPKDTPIEIQEMFDNICQKIYGWKPRKTGLFVIGNKKTAAAYGPVFSIWPIGKFKFIWSANVADFYDKITDLMEYYKLSDEPVWHTPLSFYMKNKHFLKDVETMVKEFYQDNDMLGAIASGNEIMISCDSYYALHV